MDSPTATHATRSTEDRARRDRGERDGADSVEESLRSILRSTFSPSENLTMVSLLPLDAPCASLKGLIGVSMASWGARMPVAARRMVATTSRGQSTRPPPTLPSPRSRRHGQGESSSVVIRRRTDSGGDDLRVGSSATPFRQDEEAKSDSNEDFETADSNEDFETANALALDMLRLEDLKALDRLADADPLKADVKGKGRARPSVRVRYADNESQLATRIKNLAAQGPDGLAAAVALVKTSHSRVAKVAVWTQLMQEAAHGGRWKTVRSIYLEVSGLRRPP